VASPNYNLFPEVIPAPKRRTVSEERLPTNTTTYQHPIHRWFNFIAGFSPEFVQECCQRISMRDSATVLDPFAGCATTLVTASQQGIRSIGFEPHPVFARIAGGKLPSATSIAQLDAIEATLLRGFHHPEPAHALPGTAAEFLLKLFPQPVLEALLGARSALKSDGHADDDLAFLILSKILDKSSHSQTDGIYKAPGSRKRFDSPADACRDIVGMVRADLQVLQGYSYKKLATVHEQSSEVMAQVPDCSVDLVVTSPPYLNNFDYAEMTRMYLYFWSIANSWREITDIVRSKLIVNTTTALKGHKQRQEEYRSRICDELVPELDSLIQQLAHLRTQRAGKKGYDYLIYPYFAQMTAVLHECYRSMRPGASIEIMIADAALYGVHISTPQLLHSVLDNLGYRKTSCSLVRRRGHRWLLAKREGSKTGLGEYRVTAIK
jgi:DNA modification methylase